MASVETGSDVRYWPQVATHWDAAVQAALAPQSRSTSVRRGRWQSLMTQLRGADVTILMTGERGAGKTELFRRLTGHLPDREESRSKSREDLRAAIVTHRKTRATFFVVPGQDSDPRSTMLDELFVPRGSRMPRGVIHVVSAGFDRIWGEGERNTVEGELLRQQDQRQLGITRLEEELRRLQAERDELIADLDEEIRQLSGADDERIQRLQSTIRRLRAERDEAIEVQLAAIEAEQAKSLDQHARERALRSELDRFRNLCEDYLAIGWARELPRGAQPWLVVAVTKFDLWYDEREQMKEYYLPKFGEPTTFSDQLEELGDRARGLGQIAVVPVASYPTLWSLTRTIGTRHPQLGREEVDNVLNNFRNLVGTFCEPAAR